MRAKTVSGQEIHSDRQIQFQRGKKYVQTSKNNFRVARMRSAGQDLFRESNKTFRQADTSSENT
jgi:hypothetical protein